MTEIFTILEIIFALFVLFFTYRAGFISGYSVPRVEIVNVDVTHDEKTGVFFAYDMTTGSFIGQKDNIEDLALVLAEKYTENRIVIRCQKA